MKKTLVIFIVLMLTLMSITVFAAGGQGGGSNALTLESSSISDKDINIKVDAEIELEFSNNVVNKKVSEINKESIWLKKDGQEVAVAIEIIMADDQVEPTLKRIIKVKPVESLEEGANYVLVLGKDLQSKNGITLGQAINIAFTTESKGVSSVYIAIATCIIAAIAIIFFRKNAKK